MEACLTLVCCFSLVPFGHCQVVVFTLLLNNEAGLKQQNAVAVTATGPPPAQLHDTELTLGDSPLMPKSSHVAAFARNCAIRPLSANSVHSALNEADLKLRNAVAVTATGLPPAELHDTELTFGDSPIILLMVAVVPSLTTASRRVNAEHGGVFDAGLLFLAGAIRPLSACCVNPFAKRSRPEAAERGSRDRNRASAGPAARH
ncbi:hypothetical protein SprV_0401396300 [Sparganum proliferum]